MALVGACGVGKSTIAARLRAEGYVVAEPAQEHSGIPDLWRRLRPPDVLVYLDATIDTLRLHRPSREYTPAMLAQYGERTAHARSHADLRLAVDGLTPDEATRAITTFLETRRADDGHRL